MKKPTAGVKSAAGFLMSGWFGVGDGGRAQSFAVRLS